MSCKPAKYRGKAPVGPDSAYIIELRSEDGVLVDPVARMVVFDRAPKGLQAQREFFSRPLLLVSKRYPAGKPLPILALEEVSTRGTAYSVFSKRYVFLTQRPTDGQPGHYTTWPEGRDQPVYLVSARGEARTIHIPGRPDWNKIHLALPAAPGLVFMGVGGHANNWGGLFLHDGQNVWALDRGKVETLGIAPDGCGVAYVIDREFGKKSVPFLRIKSIRFC
jgi:hypothetical protein